MIYFLVSGAPRSGTTVLQQILNTNSAVCCYHEFGLHELAKSVDVLFNVERDRNHYLAEIMPEPAAQSLTAITGEFAVDLDPIDRLSEDFDPAPIPTRARHFRKIIDSIFSTTSGKTDLRAAGDKLPNIIDGAYLDELSPVFPGLKTILMIRSPLNVIKSSLVRASATKEKRDFWHISTVEEALDEWVKNWEFAAKLSEVSNRPCLIIKYEDLKSHFDDEMERVAEFLGIPCKFTNLMDPREGNGDKFRLSAEQHALIEERAAPLIDAWASNSAQSLLNTFRVLPFIVSSGQLIATAGDKILPYVLRDGFCSVEDWGVWTSGARARIVFKIRGAGPVEKVWIDISFTSFIGNMQDFVFGITASDGDLEMIKIDAGDAAAPNANVGRLYTIVDGLVDLKFSIPRPKMLDQEPIHDLRSVGLGLKSIRATIL